MVRDAGGDQLGGGVVDERHTVVADDFNLHVGWPSFLDPLGWGRTGYLWLSAGGLQLFRCKSMKYVSTL